MKTASKACRILLIAAGVLCIVCLAFGQSAPPAFEVASVKPHEGPRPAMLQFSSSGPRATWLVFPLRGLIQEAYGIKFYQLTFAPSAQSRDMTYYNVVGKASGDKARTRDEFRKMLQSLLAERFKLAFHSESKEMPVYELVVGKRGPKFKKSAPGASEQYTVLISSETQKQTLVGPKLTMDALADALTDLMNADRPVVNRTGLKGTYYINLQATPSWKIESNPEMGDLSASTAVEEQLGLKLEKSTARLPIIVVDHWEKPTPN
jgi:uncharacterized protein (TIGR03435 family)